MSVQEQLTSLIWCAALRSVAARTARRQDSNTSNEGQHEPSVSSRRRVRCVQKNRPEANNSIQKRKRKFECGECGKTFKNKKAVTRHIPTHAGVKCEECGRKFTKKSILNRHILTHTGVKNYECEECGKKFTLKGDLTRHILTHKNVKNYQCEECGKTFTRKSYLTQHMVTHTGMKNHECEECGKTFTHKSNLTRHMLKACLHLHPSRVVNTIMEANDGDDDVLSTEPKKSYTNVGE